MVKKEVIVTHTIKFTFKSEYPSDYNNLDSDEEITEKSVEMYEKSLDIGSIIENLSIADDSQLEVETEVTFHEPPEQESE